MKDTSGNVCNAFRLMEEGRELSLHLLLKVLQLKIILTSK
jgi:hypothetical protein